jgi:hypothetical protein
MIKTNRKCQICGEPLAKGRTHDRCKPPGSMRSKQFDFKMACDVATDKIKEGLSAKVKQWTPDMGKEALKEMFPDRNFG